MAAFLVSDGGDGGGNDDTDFIVVVAVVVAVVVVVAVAMGISSLQFKCELKMHIDADSHNSMDAIKFTANHTYHSSKTYVIVHLVRIAGNHCWSRFSSVVNLKIYGKRRQPQAAKWAKKKCGISNK